MVSININFSNKFVYLVVGVLVVLIVAGVGIAATEWSTAKTMFHNSEDVKVTIDSLDYSLQEALDEGLIGGFGLGEMQATDIGQVGGTGNSLNVLAGETTGTVHQAATDGLVMLWKVGNSRGSLFIGTAEDDLEEVLRTDVREDAYGHSLGSALVKKGEFWQITKVSSGDVFAHWRPIFGSGGSGSSGGTLSCVTSAGIPVDSSGNDVCALMGTGYACTSVTAASTSGGTLGSSSATCTWVSTTAGTYKANCCKII